MGICTVDVVCGPFTVVTDSAGAVVASGWTDSAGDLRGLVDSSILADVGSDDVPPGVIAALEAYSRGDLDAPARIPVRQAGPPFLEQVWKVLRDVGPGETVTYSELAAMAGRPRAVRAAASGCARNPTSLFVPCHRVLRTGGGPGGFGWGLEVKHRLLAHEHAPV
ncbi:MAG: methylated-DNA--[protein]-cysteine S-methyltransferase [Acidimicrobiia bacterium]|nr:methylated-DNA--[protein]-cysteine S-methyltransferase [Acidimicrobiia bacterium]